MRMKPSDLEAVIISSRTLIKSLTSALKGLEEASGHQVPAVVKDIIQGERNAYEAAVHRARK